MACRIRPRSADYRKRCKSCSRSTRTGWRFMAMRMCLGWRKRQTDAALGRAANPAKSGWTCIETARKLFLWDNYAEIGIDHFATQDDGLTIAAENRQASAQFPRLHRRHRRSADWRRRLVHLALSARLCTERPGHGRAHVSAIRDGRFSTTRGHAFSDEDRMRSRMIEAVDVRFPRRCQRDHTAVRYHAESPAPDTGPHEHQSFPVFCK